MRGECNLESLRTVSERRVLGADAVVCFNQKRREIKIDESVLKFVGVGEEKFCHERGLVATKRAVNSHSVIRSGFLFKLILIL